MATRYVNTASTAGGDGTTNATTGANRAYATLSEWEAARQADLVTATDGEEVLCCGTAADTTALTINGWTTNATYYIHIKGNTGESTGQSFLASWSTSHYRHAASVAFGDSFIVNEAYTRITGIQIENTNANPRSVLFFNTGVDSSGLDGCIVSSVFARHAGTGYDRGVYAQWGSRVAYHNCIGRGANSANGVVFAAAFAGGGAAELLARNCVAAFGGTGFNSSSGDNTFTVTNCYGGGTGTADYGSSLSIANSYSEDGSQSTPTAAFSTSSGCYFTNVTYGSEDFSIGASSTLKDAGTDLSAYFTDDINGDTRSGTWDVGVDEIVSGGAEPAPFPPAIINTPIWT